MAKALKQFFIIKATSKVTDNIHYVKVDYDYETIELVKHNTDGSFYNTHDEAEKQTLENAPYDGADRNSRNRAGAYLDYSVDQQRDLVAVPPVGSGGHSLGHRRVGLLFPPRCLYLPRLSHRISSHGQGSILGIPYPQDASFDLSRLRS